MKLPLLYPVLLCAGLVSLTSPLFGQTEAPATTNGVGPKIVFLTNEYNFGKVNVGEQVLYTYIASNAGDQTLVISNVTPSCHCTSARPWTHEIAPGKTGEIPIRFDSGGLRGDVTRSITVTSNDKQAPRKTLILKGNIWKAIEYNPQTAVINVMPDETSNATTVVHIFNQDDKPLTLTGATSANALFKADLRTTLPGKQFELTVTALPPFTLGRNNTGTIVVHTSLTNLPVLNIPAIATLQPALNVAPSQVVLLPEIVGWTTNVITITANERAALALSDLSSSDDRIKLELKEVTPGRAFQIIAAFPPGFKTVPGKQAQLSVKSNNDQQPVIVVPIRQHVRQSVMTMPQAHPKVMSQNPPPPPAPAAHP